MPSMACVCSESPRAKFNYDPMILPRREAWYSYSNAHLVKPYLIYDPVLTSYCAPQFIMSA